MNEYDSIESLFLEYRDEAVITAAEAYTKFTSPTCFVRKTNTEETRQPIEKDFQSAGTKLVNSLTSKLTASLFPSVPFFQILDTPENQKALSNINIPNLSSLGIEASVANTLQKAGNYSKLYQAIKLLIITGNALIVRKNKRFKVYSVDDYSIQRDGEGEVRKIIIRERVFLSDLSKRFRSKLSSTRPTINDDERYELYTLVEYDYDKDMYFVSQEVSGIRLDTKESYPRKSCPYIVAAWNLLTGEAYGRGLVEDYSSEFASLSALTQSLREYELLSMQINGLADSSLDIQSFLDMEQGDIIAGKEGQIAVLEYGVYQKIQSISAEVMQIENGLAIPFMYSANTRDAERVNNIWQM